MTARDADGGTYSPPLKGGVTTKRRTGCLLDMQRKPVNEGLVVMGRDVNYGVHDVGSIQSMLPAEPGWVAVSVGDGFTADILGWAVVVVERSGWVVRTELRPVAVERSMGALIIPEMNYRIVKPEAENNGK